MNVLHKNEYDIGKAVADFVSDEGPVLCRDEMEEWSSGMCCYMQLFLVLDGSCEECLEYLKSANLSFWFGIFPVEVVVIMSFGNHFYVIPFCTDIR